MKLTKYGRVLSNFSTPNFQKIHHQLPLHQKKKRATFSCNSSIPQTHSSSLNFIFKHHSSASKAFLSLSKHPLHKLKQFRILLLFLLFLLIKILNQQRIQNLLLILRCKVIPINRKQNRISLIHNILLR